MCEPTSEIGRNQFDDLRMWYGLHANDCRFQKFRFLVDLAVKYGLRIETQSYPNPKWTKDSTTEPKTLSKTATCYDPAWFRESAHKNSIPGLKVCGDPKSKEAKMFSTRPWNLKRRGTRHSLALCDVSVPGPHSRYRLGTTRRVEGT